MAYKKKAPGERLGNAQLSGGLNYSDLKGQGAGVIKATSMREGIPIPGADSSWMPKAQSWFRSLKLSPQSSDWEASDWATAVSAADAYDTFLRSHNASVFGQFVRMTERLGCTFIDRQRAQIVIPEPEPADEDEVAADAALRDWQQRLGSRGGLHSVSVIPKHGDGDDGAP